MEKFTEFQIQEFYDAFCMFDKKDLGYILSSEVRDMLKTVGINPTDYTLDRLIIAIDENGDSRVDFKEFLDLVATLETDDKNCDEARDAFNAFDFMGRGYVASGDIKEALMYVMQSAKEEQREDIIKHFRLQVNRKVYFREFKEMITVKRNHETP